MMPASMRNVFRYIADKMCDKNGILAVTTNLKRNYRSEGLVYFENVDNNNTDGNCEKPYKRSNSMGKMNFKLEKNLTSLQQVPQDKNNLELVKKFVFALCQEYLGGIWKRVDIDDFEISKPNGGLSNHLYKCELKSKKFQPIHNEPNKIFVRLYGDCHQNNSSAMVKDIIVSTILSDFSMGPKLYGIFPTGRLEELIDASPLDYKDMFNTDYSCQIAEAMAQFHSLEMPFVKKPNWIFDTTYSYISQIKQHSFKDENDIKRFNKLKSFNLEQEFNELKTVLESLNSLVVFCHNDINVGNILKLEDKLMVIDYEYGGYNYRGFDLGNYFCEMMFDNTATKHPYFLYNPNKYPSKKQQLTFVKAYVRKFKEILEHKNKNGHRLNEEQLLNEANHFALASSLFWIMWSIVQASTSTIKFDYLEYALARSDAYFKHKSVLYPNGFVF